MKPKSKPDKTAKALTSPQLTTYTKIDTFIICTYVFSGQSVVDDMRRFNHRLCRPLDSRLANWDSVELEVLIRHKQRIRFLK